MATLTSAPPQPPSVVVPGPLLCLAYVSTSVRQFPAPELLALLKTSRRNNARAAVTGMLLYKGKNFMQVLEGPEEAVRAVWGRIAADPRHRHMVTVLDTWVPERKFGDWLMGFHNLDDPEVHSTPGYSEFLNVPLTGEEFAGQPSRAKHLLLAFKLKMFRAPWSGV